MILWDKGLGFGVGSEVVHCVSDLANLLLMISNGININEPN